MDGPYRQSVPRPPAARRVNTPPWAALPPASRVAVPLARLADAAARVAAQRGVAAEARTGPGSEIHSAVVLPVFERDGDTVLVLIRRAAHLSADPGHIALPGGHLERGESALEAALREAHEEIGLERAHISSVVSLGSFHRRIRGDYIAAHVAFCERRPALSPSDAEVEAVLEIPASVLLADGVAWEEHWGLLAGGERVIPFFADEVALGEDLIWGLTARILWTLLEGVVGEVPP